MGSPSTMLSTARILFEEGKTEESLRLVEAAYEISQDPKVLRKVQRLKAILAEEKENHSEAHRQSNAVAEAQFFEEKARCLFLGGNLSAALVKLEKAFSLCPTDKLQRRIDRLKTLLKQRAPEDKAENQTSESSASSESGEDVKPNKNIQLHKSENAVTPHHSTHLDKLADKTLNLSIHEDRSKFVSDIELSPGFRLPKTIFEKLYSYQRDGVAWLWNLHKNTCGGILADDMGLGKTFQTIAFLAGYLNSEDSLRKRRTAMVLAPVSVINTWQTEFSKWAPSLRVFTYYEATKNARLRGLAGVQRCGGILLTTYTTLAAGVRDLAVNQNSATGSWRSKFTDNDLLTDLNFHGETFTWDYLVLDEAHKIKNPSTKAAKAVRALSSNHRILLTGTAVQNNLRELWSLYDFTHRGQLLGSQKTFLAQYEKPITRSRERDATAAERLHGKLMADSLYKMIEPYFLRRTKAEVLSDNLAETAVQSAEDLLRRDQKGKLPRKNEIVVWLYLSPLQESIYRDFLKLDHVKELLFGTTKRSPLVELTILKKLCDHPRLLSTDQCANLGLDVSRALPARGGATEIRVPSSEQLLEESGKLSFLVRLLEQFQVEAVESGRPAHRTLVFSQSLRLLDMAELVILNINKRNGRQNLPKHRVLRLDGRLKKLSERVDVLEQFERNPSYTVMLLTTQVGGVGLTILSADRVVILDPSWNPAVDAQAVDRVYRIGQKSNVVVYRLITCATVEEKIYRRQVFKDSVIRQTTGARNADAHSDEVELYRYFTRQELRALFTLSENIRFSATQHQLAQLHGSHKRNSDADLDEHLAFITSPKMDDLVFQISDHDALFSCPDLEPPPSDSPNSVMARKFAERQLLLGEAALRGEKVNPLPNTGGFVTASSLLESVVSQHLRPPPPPPDLFIPSKADTKRAMFNAPTCNYYSKPRSLDLTRGLLPQRQSDPLPGVDAASLPQNRLSEEARRTVPQRPLLSHNDVPNSTEPVVIVSKEQTIQLDSSEVPSQLEHPSQQSPAVGNSSPAPDSAPPEAEERSTPRETALAPRERPLVTGLPDDLVASFTEMSVVESETPAKSGTLPLAGLNMSTASMTPVKLLAPGLFVIPTTPLSCVRPSNRATSTPSHRRPTEQCTDEEIIDLDISQTVDDEQLQNSVQMMSLRQSLAKSGLLVLEEPIESTSKPSTHSSASPDVKIESETDMSVDSSHKVPPSMDEEVQLVEDSCEVYKDGSTTSPEVSYSSHLRLSESVDMIEASISE
uniref:DNA excision repair protein ERCC-6-like n=1 Tax=Schistocephalus solidus TaxID=70667 RepID=A0A0X3PF09_SCHSO